MRAHCRNLDPPMKDVAIASMERRWGSGRAASGLKTVAQSPRARVNAFGLCGHTKYSNQTMRLFRVRTITPVTSRSPLVREQES